jgi:hypothetical protein
VLLDLRTAEATILTMNFRGVATANGPSDRLSMSADGRFILFRSLATDLVEEESDHAAGIYLHDRESGRTTRLAPDEAGPFNTRPTSLPLISSNGATIVFHSFSPSVVTGDFNRTGDVFAFLSPSETAVADSDDDGLNDEWELHYFGNLEQDGDDDFDGDGMSNLAEFIAGTDPTQASSVLRFLTANREGDGTVTLSWSAVAGRRYHVEFKNDLAESHWSVLPETPVIESIARQTDTGAAQYRQRFYRIAVAYP